MLPLAHESLEAFNRRKAALKKIDFPDGSRLEGHDAIFTKTSNKGLSFFQAACCWIYSTNQGYNFALIQLKKNKLFYLNQDEIFEHEKVHALRAGLTDQKYEEILAFTTSHNRLRRFLGPLLSTPSEQITTLICTLLAPTTSYLSLLFPLFLLIRLILRQNRVKRAATMLEGGALIHLRDTEIDHLAKKRDFSRPYTLRTYWIMQKFGLN
jgi:hypothetical protein